jgi:hypothetical protein
MDKPPGHPIATPKGGNSLALVLAILGIAAPFFLNLASLLVLCAVAILVIERIKYTKHHDDLDIIRYYTAWLNDSHQFLSKHEAALNPTSLFMFDQANESDTRPTLLLIHNGGIHAYNKFAAKILALQEIQKVIPDNCA